MSFNLYQLPSISRETRQKFWKLTGLSELKYTYEEYLDEKLLVDGWWIGGRVCPHLRKSAIGAGPAMISVRRSLSAAPYQAVKRRGLWESLVGSVFPSTQDWTSLRQSFVNWEATFSKNEIILISVENDSDRLLLLSHYIRGICDSVGETRRPQEIELAASFADSKLEPGGLHKHFGCQSAITRLLLTAEIPDPVARLEQGLTRATTDAAMRLEYRVSSGPLQNLPVY